MRCYDTFEGPQGSMLLVANDRGLAGVYFDRQKHHPKRQADWKKDPHHRVLRQAKRELAEYFAGKRKRFEVALSPNGTPFQRSVWRAISTVGFGETITYGELARRIGQPDAVRAVGAANGKNPIPIIVPCHRVLGADGSLVGYSAGVKTKEFLLKLEGALMI